MNAGVLDSTLVDDFKRSVSSVSPRSSPIFLFLLFPSSLSVLFTLLTLEICLFFALFKKIGTNSQSEQISYVHRGFLIMLINVIRNNHNTTQIGFFFLSFKDVLLF